jgi:thioredoxin-dependent peroxiredoxin
MSLLHTGDHAPDFTRAAHSGETVTLSEYLGRGPVVLYFYPRDHTPVCTRQACGFRDAYEDLLAAGAAVIGVSADPDETHRTFAEQHALPFPLIADEDRLLRRLFGVPSVLGLMDGRVTFVIDRNCVVRHVLQATFASRQHVEEALAVVQRLAARVP